MAMKGVPVFIIQSLAGSRVTTPKPIFPDTVGTGQGMLKFLGSSDIIYVPFLN